MASGVTPNASATSSSFLCPSFLFVQDGKQPAGLCQASPPGFPASFLSILLSGQRFCQGVLCLISHIAMKIPGKLEWDVKKELFKGNDLANSMLKRSQRYPYGVDYLKKIKSE
ncbi:MAG: hypothetical protein AB2L24_15600 [Mangrovibacterium sp.]